MNHKQKLKNEGVSEDKIEESEKRIVNELELFFESYDVEFEPADEITTLILQEYFESVHNVYKETEDTGEEILQLVPEMYDDGDSRDHILHLINSVRIGNHNYPAVFDEVADEALEQALEDLP